MHPPNQTPTLTKNERERLADLLTSLPACTHPAEDAAHAIAQTLSIDTAAARQLGTN